MADVAVTETEPGVYAVVVADGGRSTTHTVRVPSDLPGSLGCGHVPVIDLVRCSFDFLLEREPASSILGRFSLEQIGHYFPDYPEIISRRLTDAT
jgi:hypothetical protein